MGTLAEYFAANRYVSQYEIGTRLFGRWNKIPFVGTVGNDSVVNELEGRRTVCIEMVVRKPLALKDNGTSNLERIVWNSKHY